MKVCNLYLCPTCDRFLSFLVLLTLKIASSMFIFFFNFIPVGGKFPAHKVKPQVVEEHRQKEREEMQKCLADYITVCSEQKVHFSFLLSL